MISIIVTLHNKENTIVSALQSLAAQTAQKWEAVIIDNASTDGSEYQVRSYLIDRRMRYVRLNEPVTLSEARQKGLDMTTGEWVLYLDGGDYLESNALEALYLTLKKYGTLISVGNYSIMHGNEKHPQSYQHEGKYKPGTTNAVTGSALIARQVAHLPESWNTLDVAYTDHLVVISGNEKDLLIKKTKKTWKDIFRL